MPRRVVSTSGSSGITPISGPWGQKVRPPIKKPGLCRAFSVSEHAGSLDLRFLVRHVLARNGVVLLHFHLVRMEALVLGGHVEVASVGGREQLYFFAHGASSPGFTASRPWRGTRRAHYRCPSSQSCAGRRPKCAAIPSAFRSRPRNAVYAGWAGSGDAACCSRERRDYRLPAACR